MRVLVTGAAGFLGSAFVRLLGRERPDWEVTVMDKLTYAGDLRRLKDARFHFTHGDILDARLAADTLLDQDAVVHFAAETFVDRSISRPQDFIRTNVMGTQALLEGSRLVWEGAPRAFLHVSTDEVYGPVPQGRAVEDWPFRPSSPYSASKVGAEAIVRAYNITYGMRTLVIRPCNGFGPFQHPEKLVPRMTARALTGRKLPLYGSGTQKREWLHADDIAAAALVVLENGEPGGVYNVGSGHEEENLAVVRKILELAGAPESLVDHVRDRPGHDIRYALDSSRIRAIGWEPRVEFDAALAETVAWFRENRSWWEAVAEEV